MLAFNLGVFFRNLEGREVVFSAASGRSTLCFRGGVRELSERTGLTRELSVVLAQGDLACRIVIGEDEEPEGEENPEVHVTLARTEASGEEPILTTAFRFSEIKLQPATEPSDQRPPGSWPPG